MSYLDDKEGEGKLRAYEIDNGPGGISWTFVGSHGESVEYETWDELEKNHPVLEEVSTLADWHKLQEPLLQVHAVIYGELDADGRVDFTIDDADGFLSDGIIWDVTQQEWICSPDEPHLAIVNTIYDVLAQRLAKPSASVVE